MTGRDGTLAGALVVFAYWLLRSAPLGSRGRVWVAYGCTWLVWLDLLGLMLLGWGERK